MGAIKNSLGSAHARDQVGVRPAAGLCAPQTPTSLSRFRLSPRVRGLGRPRRARGQAIVEYAIIFPLLLVVTLGLIQLAHIFVAKQVVSYAAFCAARAALVSEDGDSEEPYADSHRAAAMVCSPITGSTGVEDAPEVINLPGWGELQGSGASIVKTTVDINRSAEGSYVEAEVIHRFELKIPIADELTYRLGGVLMGVEEVDRTTYGAPHINVRGHAVLAVPPER